MLITSRSNETVKAARALFMKKTRDQTGLHLIEGEKLVREAVDAGVRLKDGFFLSGKSDYAALLERGGAQLYEVTDSVLACLTESSSPQGVAATAYTPDTSAPEAFRGGLTVLLDRLQDPGNVGTIIRTADAMGVSAVIVSPDSADVWAGKTLRASMGSCYHLPIIVADIEKALARLAADGYMLLCGDLAGSSVLPALSPHTALVIGNEGQGVPENHAARCIRYRLPMPGRAESLNASVAAGILIYEISKQLKGEPA